MSEFTCPECDGELTDYGTGDLYCSSCAINFNSEKVDEWISQAIVENEADNYQDWLEEKPDYVDGFEPGEYEHLHHADCICARCSTEVEDDPDLEDPDQDDVPY
ncbi:MAG: hypothetical protein M8364_18440 [Methylobacter sp.]|uniref:hypothetical protein n=1 Tax=Methylobacter sp. TaxID=2051955 RepID=UPI0025881D84|nr:hypothetical protein [Methylobacter sp.]MCL7422873.1 hypothetical protein [Methylobacter sp.]